MVIERSKSVVLFSGGIDSLACLRWAIKTYEASNVAALYVKLGVAYSNYELDATSVLAERFGVEITYLNWNILGSHEDKNGHVPLRNVFLLEIAYLYGWNVVFGMLKGEYSEDKNPAFVKHMQKLFDIQSKRNLYNTGERITIHTPFSGMTKTQVVRWLLDNQVSAVLLGNTVGCLKEVTCGKCMSCFNRAVALENNGLGDLDLYNYENHPAHWGIKQLTTKSDTFKRAKNNVSFWLKRYWIIDVYNAYNSWYKRGIVVVNPRELISKLLL